MSCSPSCSQGNEADVETGLDPYTYTDGRFLRRDREQRNARYLNFDFDALCKRALELCPGAVSIREYEKKEGEFNRVFIFTCDNRQRIVVRLPSSLAGPLRWATNSEVATIRYGKLE